MTESDATKKTVAAMQLFAKLLDVPEFRKLIGEMIDTNIPKKRERDNASIQTDTDTHTHTQTGLHTHTHA